MQNFINSNLFSCFVSQHVWSITHSKLSSHSVTINIIVKIHINYSIGQAFCVCCHLAVTMNIARTYRIRWSCCFCYRHAMIFLFCCVMHYERFYMTDLTVHAHEVDTTEGTKSQTLLDSTSLYQSCDCDMFSSCSTDLVWTGPEALLES